MLAPGVWSVRNLVHSGLVHRLQAAGVRPHLLVGSSPEDWLRTSIEAAVSCSPLRGAPVVRSTRGKPTLDALLRASFCRRHRLATYPVLSRWERVNATPWQQVRNVAVEVLGTVGAAEPFLRWQVANLERMTRRTRDLDAAREHLGALRPVLLVSTACIDRAEEPYLLAARDLGIPTLGCILSFDNLTSRSVLPVFDWYAVWNDRMRHQVLTLYPGRRPDRIHITGTPQFDFHVQPAFRPPRARVLETLGFAPDERYIVYATNSTYFTPSEPRLVRAFAHAAAAHRELRNHRIVVRPHPLDDFARWESVTRTCPNVAIRLPWGPAQGPFTPDEQARLIGLLLHADVCLNTASSISLDAAAVDTPVVCVTFAGQRGGEEDRLCRDIYHTEHYGPVAASGGVRLAGDLDELVAETAAYAQQRARDADARRRLVDNEVGPVDGRAADRIAALMHRLADELAHPPATGRP